MLRQLFKDSFFYSLPAIFGQGVAVFLIPLYTRVLSPADYGVLDLLLMFGSLANLVVAFEVSQGVARFHVEQDSRQGQIELASTALWFSVGCYLLFLGLSWHYAEPLAQWLLGSSERAGIFREGLLMISIHGIYLLLQNQFRWELQSRRYAFANVLTTSLTMGGSVLLAWYLEYGLHGILLARIVGEAIGSLFCAWRLAGSFSFTFALPKLKTMLWFSVPLIPSSISVFVSLYVDRLMINHYLNLHDLGLYGLAYRVSSVSSLILAGFQQALTPLIYRYYREEQTPLQIAAIFRNFCGLASLAILFLGLFSLDILHLFTTPQFYGAAGIVHILAAALVFSQMYIFAPGIDIAKKTWLLVLINFSGGCINAALIYLLIPGYGLAGAATGKLLTYLGVFSLTMLISQRLYRVPHRWLRLIGTGLALLLLLLVNRALPGQLDWLQLTGLRLGLLAVHLLLLFAFGILRCDEFRKLADGILARYQRRQPA